MTARNWGRCWMAFVSHALLDAGDREPVRIGSLLTRATAIPTVVACSTSGRSSTRFHNDVTSRRNGRRDQVARWPLIGSSTRGATWSSAVSIGSNSGVAWRHATRSARQTTARWWSSPRSSSGSTRDASATDPRPISRCDGAHLSDFTGKNPVTRQLPVCASRIAHTRVSAGVVSYLETYPGGPP